MRKEFSKHMPCLFHYPPVNSNVGYQCNLQQLGGSAKKGLSISLFLSASP